MNRQQSTSIKVCRILCIFLMTYVHVNPGKSNWPPDAPTSMYYLYLIMADWLGRASVPALSIISGYLAVLSYPRYKNWLDYSKNKARNLILPLFTWNLLIVCFSITIFFITSKTTSVYQEIQQADLSVRQALDFLVATNYGSLTEALNFLRDIFVCALLTPVLLFLMKQINLTLIVLIWTIGLCFGFDPFVLRASILMFFVLGIYLATHGGSLLPNKITGVNCLIALVIAASIAQTSTLVIETNYPVKNFIYILFISSSFIAFSSLLARNAIGNYLAKFDLVCFPFFLSHSLILTFLWGTWQLFFGMDISWPYQMFFLLSPLVALTMISLIYPLSTRFHPYIQILLWGKTSRVN